VTRIKICGLFDIEAVLVAVEEGADFLGFVFAESNRQVSPEKALQLAEIVRNQKRQPELVGVFVNSLAQEVNSIADFCGLDMIQLSGDESWEYCLEIKRPIIKTIHIPKVQKADDVIMGIEKGYQLLNEKNLICLLDTHSSDLYGGTGQVFDWQMAEEVSKYYPVFIAGGLTPTNVSKLVKSFHPWGVDVSSGVESNGKKNISKIRNFIKAVKES